MTDYLSEITVGEIMAAIAAAVVAAGALRKVWKPIRALGAFLADWNGAPERTDRAGNVIEAARPGVPALLETVRSQVQNSHRTNFRDDLDANTETTQHAVERIEEVAAKLDAHITIAKQYDTAQEETARQVQRLADKWASEH